MSRLLLCLLLLASPARASRFDDLGPSLGLPIGTPGAPVTRSLVASISAVDIDADGDDDILATDPLRGFMVYLRDGAEFVLAPAWGASVNDAYGHTAFDMDGDGDRDVYVATSTGNRLFDNVGDKLVDVTAGHLPDEPGWAFTATAVDIDGDRDLDLLVARYIDRTDFPMHRCLDNLVFENDGRGHFRNITAELGLRSARGCSFMMVAHDFDGDSDLDLFVVNDFSQFTGGTDLWRNVGRNALGRPQFESVGRELGFVAPAYGMGLAIGDLDENGREDFLVTNIGSPLMFEMGADGKFASNTRGTHIRYGAERNYVTWTAWTIDLDRDGYLDILAASGKLNASNFLDNSTNAQPLWLRGRADGMLAVTTRQLEIENNSTRDFARSDIDGDGRPELLAMHMHGGISVLRDLEPTPLATTLALTPSATASGAAGAFITLRCGQVTRTRRVVGGGGYGNDDDGEVEISFPPPCDGAGRALDGEIRWPSGFVQAVTARTGERTTIVEPAWLTLATAGLDVDLSQHALAFDVAAPRGFGVSFGAAVALGPRHWRWPVVGGASALGAATIELDGHAMGMLVRVGVAPIATWFDPAVPVSGEPLTVYARGAALTIQLGDGAPVPFAAFDGVLVSATTTAPAAGEVTLSIETASGLVEETVSIAPKLSDERSELIVRELHLQAFDVSARSVRVRFRLRDANNRLASIPIDALGIEIDGVLYEAAERGFDGDTPALIVPHALLRDGAVLQALVEGDARFAPLVVRHVGENELIGTSAAPDFQFCALSEPYLRADGNDRGSLLLQLFDASGVRLPDMGQSLSIEAEGVTIEPREVTTAYGGWLVPVHAGNSAGTARVSAWLAGQTVPVSCEFPLLPALPVREVAEGSPLVSLTGTPEIDLRTTFRFTPQDSDGLAIGSGVAFRFEVDGAIDEPLSVEGRASYAGIGAYEVSVTPTREGELRVAAIGQDERVLALRVFAIAPRDVGAESEGVEVVEPDVADAMDAEPEAMDSAEVGPEAVDSDDGPDLAPDVDEREAEVVELVPVDAEVAAEIGPELVESTPAEVVEPLEDDVSQADPEVEAEPRARDEGCEAGGGGVGMLLAAARLLGLRRPRRGR